MGAADTLLLTWSAQQRISITVNNLQECFVSSGSKRTYYLWLFSTGTDCWFSSLFRTGGPSSQRKPDDATRKSAVFAIEISWSLPNIPCLNLDLVLKENNSCLLGLHWGQIVVREAMMYGGEGRNLAAMSHRRVFMPRHATRRRSLACPTSWQKDF